MAISIVRERSPKKGNPVYKSIFAANHSLSCTKSMNIIRFTSIWHKLLLSCLGAIGKLDDLSTEIMTILAANRTGNAQKKRRMLERKLNTMKTDMEKLNITLLNTKSEVAVQESKNYSLQVRLSKWNQINSKFRPFRGKIKFSTCNETIFYSSLDFSPFLTWSNVTQLLFMLYLIIFFWATEWSQFEYENTFWALWRTLMVYL